MSDLFKKLNTLVQASINDLLGDGWSPTDPNRRRIAPDRLGKDIDREILNLRQRVNQALEHQTTLQNQLAQFDEEYARWDQQADDAVARGDTLAARYAVEQVQRVERRRTSLEADLREHQRVTQELVERVNMLDAAVADARRAQEAKQPSQEIPMHPTVEKAGSALDRASKAMSDVLRETQEKIQQFTEPAAPPAQTAPPAADPKKVDDDLRNRIDRLSKK